MQKGENTVRIPERDISRDGRLWQLREVEKKTYVEIASEFNISKERVRQLHRRMLREQERKANKKSKSK